MHIVLTIVQFVSCAAIIALVLIQRGKGADAGAGFGAGASGTVFGARGAGTALSRATAILVAVFMLNSLALAYMGTRKPEAQKTIFDTAGETAPAASSPLRVTVPGGGANPGAAAIPAPAAPAGSAPK
ncbi:MAG TPA: preprotein translocase subunit SecG [Steroidobacteraceae bacterium]|nr:preprotein translocase subunit SecG [Steroidobacteraceae bacterium]